MYYKLLWVLYSLLQDIERLDLSTGIISRIYLLNNHYHDSLPVDYIDSSKHIFLATRTAQILYAKAEKT